MLSLYAICMILCEWRKRNRVTQTALATACGTSASYISQIETGVRRPGPALAKRIEAFTHGQVLAAALLGVHGRAEPTKSGVSEERIEIADDQARVDLAIPAQVLETAQRYSVDIRDALVAGGLPELKKRNREAFMAANAEAVEWLENYVEEHGTFATRFGVFSPQ